MTDLMVVLALTVGTCLAAGLLGAALLHLLRRRSLRYQLAIAALLPVGAVALTVLLNVRLMFLSDHDARVIIIALLVATPLAIMSAWLVMRRIARGSALLGAGLQQLVADSSTPPRTGTARAVPTGPDRFASVTEAPPQELAAVLSELSETRQSLAETRDRQRAAEQARRELVGFMSHDLRTPLAGLRALAEGLEDGVVSDVPRALGHLRSTVNRMSSLVDDLFELSRVQGDREPKPQRLVSLTELIMDVGSEVAATADNQEVVLVTDVPDDDRLAVLGSADDLARAVSNLVVNAVRHTQPGRTVRLAAERAADGHVRVAVVDACGGIPDEHLPRVFDAGWRGTPSRGGDADRADSGVGGAGLGLAIARGVVESHDGRIAVRNVTGGCAFEVDLPVPDARSASS